VQRYTIFFITDNALHVWAVSPPIIRSSRTVHTGSGMCLACLKEKSREFYEESTRTNSLNGAKQHDSQMYSTEWPKRHCVS